MLQKVVPTFNTGVPRVKSALHPIIIVAAHSAVAAALLALMLVTFLLRGNSEIPGTLSYLAYLPLLAGGLLWQLRPRIAATWNVVLALPYLGHGATLLVVGGHATALAAAETAAASLWIASSFVLAYRPRS